MPKQLRLLNTRLDEVVSSLFWGYEHSLQQVDTYGYVCALLWPLAWTHEHMIGLGLGGGFRNSKLGFTYGAAGGGGRAVEGWIA